MIKINITEDCFRDMLENRFREMINHVSDGADSLKEQFFDYCIDVSDCFEDADPWLIVDSYIINGDFITPEDAGKGYFKDKTWEEICDDSIIYNDKYALWQC